MVISENNRIDNLTSDNSKNLATSIDYYADQILKHFSKGIFAFRNINEYFLDKNDERWYDLGETKQKLIIESLLNTFTANELLYNKVKIDYSTIRSNVALIKQPSDQYVFLANYFLDHYSIKTNWFTKDMWFYLKGVYNQFGEPFILAQIHEIMPTYSKQARNEILEKIRISTQFTENPFNKEHIIVVQNGVIDLKRYINEEEYFFPHSATYLSTKKLPVTYNPDKKCPKIEEFFNLISLDQKEFKLEYLYEIIADCMNNHYKSQKGHLFLGDGDNGKGTFLRLLEKFFGKENTSSLPLNLITEQSFQLFRLQNSMLNIVGDVSDKYLIDPGTIKKALGEDPMTANVKNVRQPLEFYNTSKILISTQHIPKTNEDNHGWYRRWIITSWNFTVSKRDKEFEPKLHTEDELSGLLNKVLTVYLSFYNKDFVYTDELIKTRHEKRNDYLLRSNPVQVFEENFLAFDDEESAIMVDNTFKCFDKWRKIMKLKPITKAIFGKNFRSNHKDDPIKTRQNKDMNNKRAYYGVRLNSRWHKFTKNMNISEDTGPPSGQKELFSNDLRCNKDIIQDIIRNVNTDFIGIEDIIFELNLMNIYVEKDEIVKELTLLLNEGNIYEPKPDFYKAND